jgi:hypothetical protein
VRWPVAIERLAGFVESCASGFAGDATAAAA